MSDGPHRSLPLKRRWKTVAERSSKDAWSVEDVVEATFHALERDLGEAPVQFLQRILGVGPEASLFGGDHEAVLNELDYARIECRGSAIGNAAIDGAIQAVLEGLAGGEACKYALEHALERTFKSHSRSIEEHYQRKAGDRSARHMRDRLAAVGSRCDFSSIALRHSQSSSKEARTSGLSRRAGLDDGPAMPL